MAPRRSPLFTLSWLALALALAGIGPDAAAHDERVGVVGRKVMVRTDGAPELNRFAFIAADARIRLGHDPRAEGASLLVRGEGANAGSSGVINLDPTRWTAIGSAKRGLSAYVYKDPSGARGGITTVILREGGLLVWGSGENWTWSPSGSQDDVWVYFRIEDEFFCSRFAEETNAWFQANSVGNLLARQATSPGFCPDQLCGNGVHELGEECDDGNLEDNDSCTNACVRNNCPEVDYATTYEAIQGVVFEGYGCTNNACHGDAMQGELDLRANVSYEALFEVTAIANQSLLRVKPIEPEESFLYQKLAAKTLGTELVGGSPMPTGAETVSEEHLRAMREWIRAGAGNADVVAGTADLLGQCLPPPSPLKAPIPDAPLAGEGLQLRMTPRPLPGAAESEICMPTYYDLYGKGIVPESAIIDCPKQYQLTRVCQGDPETECDTDADCGGATCQIANNALNPEGKCFVFGSQTVTLDPQSHHEIIFIYRGAYDTTDPGWGDWTYKLEDESDPLHGQSCEPTAVDDALGYNPGCSGAVEENIACITYGPPDYSNFASFFGADGNAPQLLVAQEPFLDLQYPDGVYEILPMRGVIVWNSHAFNLTNEDSTLAAYLNLGFSGEDEQNARVDQIFDANQIFTQDVPPFETREYCKTYTVPKRGRVFRFASHNHRFGTLFRIWGPPNQPCNSECPQGGLCFADDRLPLCDGPGPAADAIYTNVLYNDPLQLYFDPPIEHDEDAIESRTYKYCALYDNHSTSGSPPLKRQSTSPEPSLSQLAAIIGAGGPCLDSEVKCANEGPMKGQLCQANDAICDSSPGAGDGDCDACNVRGGVTTEDEMFILLGSQYCEDDVCIYDQFPDPDDGE